MEEERDNYRARLAELEQQFGSLVLQVTLDPVLKELEGDSLEEFKQERIIEILR